MIPAEALGTAPAGGKTWLAAVALQVARPDGPAASATWPIAKRDGILDGSRLWGELRFLPAAK